jgi:dephospho-CoA kinase
MYKIGLIGGIGSGKSTVAKGFSKFEITVIDADAIIRELTSKNTAIFQKIIGYFGSNALANNGELDRTYLRNTIFKNNRKKKWLERLLHPLAYKELECRANQARSPYCILVIPLLAESPPPHKLLDRVLLVTAPKKLQIERAIKRDKTNSMLIKTIIASQATNKQRLAIADDVIKNNKSINMLRNQIYILHERYLKLGGMSTVIAPNNVKKSS